MEKMNLSIVNMLNIVTLFVTMLFIFQIYFLKKKSKSNTFFSMYLFNIVIILVFFLFLDLKFENIAYPLVPFLLFSVLSIGPMLWIYVKLVIGEESKKLKKHLYIPIGFGIVTLILVVTDLIISDTKTSLFIRQTITYLVLTGLIGVFLLQSVYYSYLSLVLYKKHLKNIGETFSYTEKVNLNWFKFLIYGYIFLILGLITSHVVDDSISYFMFYIILLIYVTYSGYFALKQDPVFDKIESVNFSNNDAVEKTNNINFKELKLTLLTTMDEEKLYLDSSLTIHSLANKINSNSKYVSQLINNDLNKNFVMFVNEYRIQEAKKLLLNKETGKLTIESIGYDTGFKSKSAFNRAFKKYTNITPSEFRKSS